MHICASAAASRSAGVVFSVTILVIPGDVYAPYEGYMNFS